MCAHSFKLRDLTRAVRYGIIHKVLRVCLPKICIAAICSLPFLDMEDHLCLWKRHAPNLLPRLICSDWPRLLRPLLQARQGTKTSSRSRMNREISTFVGIVKLLQRRKRPSPAIPTSFCLTIREIKYAKCWRAARWRSSAHVLRPWPLS